MLSPIQAGLPTSYNHQDWSVNEHNYWGQSSFHLPNNFYLLIYSSNITTFSFCIMIIRHHHGTESHLVLKTVTQLTKQNQQQKEERNV